MNYNLKAINANKQLQSSLGLQADGLWGDNSQLIYNCTNKKLDFNWAKLRNHFGNFNQSQVNGFNAILDAINSFDISHIKNTSEKEKKLYEKGIKPCYAAYMLATAWHETAHTVKPIEEYGKGKGRRYGNRIDIHGGRYSDSLPIVMAVSGFRVRIIKQLKIRVKR